MAHPLYQGLPYIACLQMSAIYSQPLRLFLRKASLKRDAIKTSNFNLLLGNIRLKYEKERNCFFADYQYCVFLKKQVKFDMIRTITTIIE